LFYDNQQMAIKYKKCTNGNEIYFIQWKYLTIKIHSTVYNLEQHFVAVQECQTNISDLIKHVRMF